MGVSYLGDVVDVTKKTNPNIKDVEITMNIMVINDDGSSDHTDIRLDADDELTDAQVSHILDCAKNQTV